MEYPASESRKYYINLQLYSLPLVRSFHPSPLPMAVAPSDIESESGDSGASCCFSDHGALDTDTDIDAVASNTSFSLPTSPRSMLEQRVSFRHPSLHTEFTGVRHRSSVEGADVHQFRGIKYGTVPMRFRKPVMNEQFSAKTDATRNG